MPRQYNLTNMKKQDALSAVAVITGLIVSFLTMTALFNIFHWPNARLFLLMAACLVACLCCVLIVYVFKFGLLKTLIEMGIIGAKSLFNMEITGLVLLIIICIGIFIKLMHISGGGLLLVFSLLAFSMLAIIAGFSANQVLRETHKESRPKIVIKH